MSEKSPFAKQLENFDDIKAKQWEDDIVTHREGEDEITPGTPKHKQQLEEADAYYKHMEKMAQRPSIVPRSANPSETLNQSLTYMETDDFSEKEKESINAEFAANPRLRQLEMIAQSIDEVGANSDKSKEFRGRFDELLDRYANEQIKAERAATGDESDEPIDEMTRQSMRERAVAYLRTKRELEGKELSSELYSDEAIEDEGQTPEVEENSKEHAKKLIEILGEKVVAEALKEYANEKATPEEESEKPESPEENEAETPVPAPAPESNEDKTKKTTEIPKPEEPVKKRITLRQRIRHWGVKASATGKAIARSWRSVWHRFRKRESSDDPKSEK